MTPTTFFSAVMMVMMMCASFVGCRSLSVKRDSTSNNHLMFTAGGTANYENPTATKRACQYKENMKMSNTSLPLSPPSFVDSGEECCALCAADCKAAVFDNYRCTLYGYAAEYVVGVASVLCVRQEDHTVPPNPPTTPPPTPSSIVPAPTPPTHTPNTPAPLSPTTLQPDSAPPSLPTVAPSTPSTSTPAPTTTPAPTSPTKNTSLLLRTECPYSADCSVVEDPSCRTYVMQPGECYSTVTRDGTVISSHWWCDEAAGYVERKTWNNGNCSGFANPPSQHSLGTCHPEGKPVDGDYRLNRCVSVAEEAGHPVYHRNCDSKSSELSKCTTAFFRTGECSGIADEAEPGNSIKMITGDDFVWFRTYDSDACTGPERRSLAAAFDVTYGTDDTYITWSTVSHNITQAPLPNTTPETVGLMLRMECDNSATTSTCDRQLDSRCRSRAYRTDTCTDTVDGTPTIHRCYPGYNGVSETYTDANCTGLPQSVSENINNTCYYVRDGTYRRNSCASVQLKKGDAIFRTSCENGRNGQCTTIQFISGQCSQSVFKWDQPYIMAYCGDDFVWFETHSQSDCSGAYSEGLSNPLNTTYQDESNRYVTWLCERPN